jgi:hypothetical protein
MPKRVTGLKVNQLTLSPVYSLSKFRHATYRFTPTIGVPGINHTKISHRVHNAKLTDTENMICGYGNFLVGNGNGDDALELEQRDG